MITEIKLRLSQGRAYWWTRGVITSVLFGIEARLFTFRYGLRNEQSNYSSLRTLFSATTAPLIAAAVFAALLQTVDFLLQTQYAKSSIAVPNDSDYVAFLVAIITIGGLFIGLYYAALSAVGSAIYARAPNNIRDLLAQERSGNLYMRYLSFLTVLCMILIALRLVGFPRIALAIPVITLFAAIGIFGFVRLGRRAFDLFDPTALSLHLFEDLDQWLMMVRAGGFRWLNKSFQNHAYLMASASIDTLETLAELVRKEPHLTGKPFIGLSRNLVRFLIRYEAMKRQIPTNSTWYKIQYEHRDWYRTEDTRVSIAHQTGTALDPLITNDKEWIEKRMFPIIWQCFELNIGAEKYAEVTTLANHLEVYAGRLSREGHVDIAFALVEELLSRIFETVSKQPANTDRREILEVLALAEQISAMPIRISLEYRKLSESLNAQRMENRIQAIQWNDKASIYLQDFATHCLGRLEWLQPRLAFENSIEGNYVSPLWYRSELLRQVEAESFVKNAKALIEGGSNWFRTAIARALDRERPWLAAAIMSREWEYWHKVTDQIEAWEDNWQALSGERLVEGLSWPEFDLKGLRQSIENRQEELLQHMSKQSLLLSLATRPSGFPDYAGQFLHTSGEAAFNSLLHNRATFFANIFEPYLLGCVIRYEFLRPKADAPDWSTRNDFKIAAAVLLDAMDVSGYAKIFADLHGNQAIWNVVTAAWDKCRAQDWGRPPQQVLGAVIAITESDFEIPHRAFLRGSWQQMLARRLSKVPRHQLTRQGRFGFETVIEHESALVRVFAGDEYGTFHDGIDVFIALYVRSLEGGAAIDFGRKRRDLQDALDRETRRAREILQQFREPEE